MNFGEALEIVKNYGGASREGWNRKDMYIYLYPDDDPEIRPCIALSVNDEFYQPGWVPSQADMLANDWQFEAIED